MIQFMLDTNICIYIIRQKPIHVIEQFRQTQISDIGISSITYSELEYGIRKSTKPEQNQFALSQFLAPLEILSYDGVAAHYYGNIRAYLEKQGTPISSLDMLIAAHSLSLNCTLITNNEKEFIRVPNLKVANWI